MGWNPNYKRKSKTYTSSEVKDRWNAKHYDQILFRTGKGGKQAIQAMADHHGLSMAEYIRHLIIADAESEEMPEISAILGGGGDLTEFIAACAFGAPSSKWDNIPDDNPSENWDSPQW